MTAFSGISHPGRTVDSHPENGVPLSRACIRLAMYSDRKWERTHKCPQLARGGCEVCQATEDDHRDKECNHDAGACIRFSNVVKHLDERITSWSSENFIQVANRHYKRTDCHKAESPVRKRRPHHGPRKGVRGILEFFAHVRCRIRSNEREYGRQYANETR